MKNIYITTTIKDQMTTMKTEQTIRHELRSYRGYQYYDHSNVVNQMVLAGTIPQVSLASNTHEHKDKPHNQATTVQGRTTYASKLRRQRKQVSTIGGTQVPIPTSETKERAKECPGKYHQISCARILMEQGSYGASVLTIRNVAVGNGQKSDDIQTPAQPEHANQDKPNLYARGMDTS